MIQHQNINDLKKKCNPIFFNFSWFKLFILIGLLDSIFPCMYFLYDVYTSIENLISNVILQCFLNLIYLNVLEINHFLVLYKRVRTILLYIIVLALWRKSILHKIFYKMCKYLYLMNVGYIFTKSCQLLNNVAFSFCFSL